MIRNTMKIALAALFILLAGLFEMAWAPAVLTLLSP